MNKKIYFSKLLGRSTIAGRTEKSRKDAPRSASTTRETKTTEGKPKLLSIIDTLISIVRPLESKKALEQIQLLKDEILGFILPLATGQRVPPLSSTAVTKTQSPPRTKGNQYTGRREWREDHGENRAGSK